jgi:hypothetical protein
MTLAFALALLVLGFAGRGPRPPSGPFEYRPDWWD